MFHDSAAAAGQRARLPQKTTRACKKRHAHTKNNARMQKTARARKKRRAPAKYNARTQKNGARMQKSAEKIKNCGGRALSKREAGKYDDRATLQNTAFSARFANSKPPKPPFSVKIGEDRAAHVRGNIDPAQTSARTGKSIRNMKKKQTKTPRCARRKYKQYLLKNTDNLY